jgi:hypothetical protein
VKTFIVIFATLGIFILSISLSLCAFIVVADNTYIGKVIRDYILSKIIERKE